MENQTEKPKGKKKEFNIDDYEFPQPLNKQVIVEPMDYTNKSGILLLEGSKSVERYGKVIMISADCDIRHQCKVGDIVSYTPWEDKIVFYEGKPYLRMHEQAIYFVLPEKKKDTQ
jgi:co-chaperonin GroES (HSP10)